jgi:predicted dehydrogenase
MKEGTGSVIKVAVLGAGQRGEMFADLLAEQPHLAKVVAVAEPREAYRKEFAEKHRLSPDNVYEDWQAFVENPPECDAVVIATMDQDHVDPAVACLKLGKHLLLEKPMAVTLEDCQAIEEAQRGSGAYVAVCHSLRYQKGFARLKEIVASGRIGKVVSIDQLEQVGFWHQAHSFVRGNWGNEERATFMLLAKSCHDLDYVAHLAGKECLRVSSFGSLSHFTEENAPEGATERCTDGCPVEATCPFSALRAYVHTESLENWPAAVVSPVHTKAAHLDAIRTGPYGRCVYRCDNDVVDHQVVAMEFEGEITATFTMTAFTQNGGRKVRVHGTAGEVSFDEGNLIVRMFATGDTETIDLAPEPGGHGGGDARVIREWLAALHADNPELIRTSAQESLRTHKIVFAAERSRREKRQVELSEL